jgi:hypothetical protein
MIQRVQSIYLLLITVLMSFLLIRPYADLTLVDTQSLVFRAHAITIQSGPQDVELYKTTIPVVLLTLITGLLSFCTIFFYNHRIYQIRLSMINAVLIVMLIICMLTYSLTIKQSLQVTDFSFRMAMIYPVLSLIFCIMAIRAIQHDEILVNSYNRLR